MNHTTILEDSPNGFPIVHNAPRVNFEKGHGVEDAIRYYLKEMVKYNRLDRPVEYALINYNDGKIFLADKKDFKGALGTGRNVLKTKDYPAQFVLICVFMAQLFRERTDIMMDGRSYLVKNGQSTPEESIQYGIDQLLQAMPIFTTLNAQLDEKRKGAAAAAVSLVSSSPRSDWTERKYRKNLKSEFPRDLATLCKALASMVLNPPCKCKERDGNSLSSSSPSSSSEERPSCCGRPFEYEPEAAIVNYYPCVLGTCMGGHKDDAEHTMEKPIVSLNIGCSAIFLIGGRSKEDKPVPILVRSGDVLIMSGESRHCFHGVPCILPHTFQYGDSSTKCNSIEGDDDDDNDDGHERVGKGAEQVADRKLDRPDTVDEKDRILLQYLKVARININVRQVTVDPTNDTVWEEKCGSGAMNYTSS